MAWQHTRSDWRVLRSAVYPVLWMGILGVSEEDEGTVCEDGDGDAGW
jgi:hypothetical protein